MNVSKLRFSTFAAAGALAASLLLGAAPSFAQSDDGLRIGFIGSGRMGGPLGLRLAEAGHEVLFSSRNPETLSELVDQAGGNARAGSPCPTAPCRRWASATLI